MTVTNAIEAPADDGLIYGYKPSLMGAPHFFVLSPDALEWNVGRYSGRIPYNSIRKMRQSFRPQSMQTNRYLTEIWPVEGPKLQIASTSWKSIVEHQRNDKNYRDFIVELNRRMAAAGCKASLISGTSPYLYWPGLILFVGVSLGLAYLTVRALQAETYPGAAMVAVILAFFLWQVGAIFRRNKPGFYAPGAPPGLVLPPV